MTQNDNKEVQYIWHDGVRIREDQLISMAKNASTYEEAKCYIISLMVHGLVYGIYDYINKVNEIRVRHHVPPMPIPKAQHDEIVGNNKEELARKKYKMLNDEQKLALLKNGLYVFADNHIDLRNKKAVWIGVYHVVHDRLDGSIVKATFNEVADAIVPDNWPEKYKISDATMANYAHYILYEDSFEAYYDMEDNPFDEFCNVLWELLESIILTSAYE